MLSDSEGSVHLDDPVLYQTVFGMEVDTPSEPESLTRNRSKHNKITILKLFENDSDDCYFAVIHREKESIFSKVMDLEEKVPYC